MNILGTEDGRYRETLRSLPFYYDPIPHSWRPSLNLPRWYYDLSWFGSKFCACVKRGHVWMEYWKWEVGATSHQAALMLCNLSFKGSINSLKLFFSTLFIYCEFFKIKKLTNNKGSLFIPSFSLRWETVFWECVNSWYPWYIRYTCLQRKWSDIRRTKSWVSSSGILISRIGVLLGITHRNPSCAWTRNLRLVGRHLSW